MGAPLAGRLRTPGNDISHTDRTGEAKPSRVAAKGTVQGISALA
jgi:3-hydroxyisobutyrate dehydrogenase-like beta-hydroxyacid dehydrogenase